MKLQPRWNTASETAFRGALVITAIYLAVGFLWIAVSDSVVASLAQDPVRVHTLQNLKGWAFVTVTGLGFFWLIYRSLHLAVRSGELETQVSYDTLTGLPNTALLTSQMNRALMNAEERRNTVAVLAIHVDGIRQINESLGPTAGDQVLATVADRLRQAVAPGDLLARHEGSSFIAVLDGSNDAERPSVISQAILKTVGEPVLVAGTELRPKASVGVSRFPNDAESPRELIAAAATAMSRAREKGGWHIHHYTARLTRAAYERFRLENDLRQAVEHGELQLAWQPQVRLADGQAVGVECLVRWTHPDLGPVPPSRFIPLAEETGLILPLGEWVMRQACHQVATWRAEGVADLRLAVNLSARQFGYRRLWRYVDQVLKESGLPADRLEIEITETMTARDPDVALRILRSLKDVGVSIAVDDFGMGYSSLSYLQLLPIDRLKIDRSFVAALHRDPRGEAICRTILDMGRNLILMTLAEGIENEEQRRLLLNYGCEEGQGFLFARPMTALDIPGWLGVEPVRGERRPLPALAM